MRHLVTPHGTTVRERGAYYAWHKTQLSIKLTRARHIQTRPWLDFSALLVGREDGFGLHITHTHAYARAQMEATPNEPCCHCVPGGGKK